jgi:hypothetical protein
LNRKSERNKRKDRDKIFSANGPGPAFNRASLCFLLANPYEFTTALENGRVAKPPIQFDIPPKV